MLLTETERITLLMMRGYGDRQRSFQEVADLFNETFPIRPAINKSTVLRTVNRFHENGNVKDRAGRGRRRSATADGKSLDILQTFVENPHTSIRKSAMEHDVSHTSVLQILKRGKFHPFKIHLVHELLEDDFDRRVEFCDTVMEKCHVNPNFVRSVLFSDEATFVLNGNVNRHNCRYWSDENPRWMREAHTQYPQKLNVWAGIIGNRIVGPVFIDGNLDGDKYFDILFNTIIPQMQEMLGPDFCTTWFQQDGAPPHHSLRVRQLLNETFPDRWIGRRGSIEWPARSPDLSPLDYFFWGALKQNVYKTKPANIDELKQRIIHEAEQITPNMLDKSLDEFYFRLAHCQEVDGRQYEHLL